MGYCFWIVAYLIGSLYVLWLFYLAAMSITRAYEGKTLSKPALWLGVPVMVVAVLIDVLVNVFVMTILFLELPRQWLVTQRLSKWCCTERPSWRKTVAKWVCANFLDTFDPSGLHCK